MSQAICNLGIQIQTPMYQLRWFQCILQLELAKEVLTKEVFTLEIKTQQLKHHWFQVGIGVMLAILRLSIGGSCLFNKLLIVWQFYGTGRSTFKVTIQWWLRAPQCTTINGLHHCIDTHDPVQCLLLQKVSVRKSLVTVPSTNFSCGTMDDIIL